MFFTYQFWALNSFETYKNNNNHCSSIDYREKKTLLSVRISLILRIDKYNNTQGNNENKRILLVLIRDINNADDVYSTCYKIVKYQIY